MKKIRRLKPWQWVTLIAYMMVLNVVIGTILFLLIDNRPLVPTAPEVAPDVAVSDESSPALEAFVVTPSPAPLLWATATAGLPTTDTDVSLSVETPTLAPTSTPQADTAAALPTATMVPTEPPLIVNATAVDTLTQTDAETSIATDTPIVAEAPSTSSETANTDSEQTQGDSGSVSIAAVPTATAKPSPTATNTATPLPTSTATATATATATPTETATATATATPLPTETHTPTATATPEPTATPTLTHTPTPPPTDTATATATATPSPTETATTTPTSEPTATATPEATSTSQPTATATTTNTHTATAPETTEPSPTATATLTTTPVPTNTPLPTNTPSPTASATATATATVLPPTATPTDSASEASISSHETLSIQAGALTERSISLIWTPATDKQTYRLFSDMGTGFGVYIYQGQTDKADYVDQKLRAGMNYAYRLDSADSPANLTLAFVSTATYHRAPVAGAGLASAISIRATPTRSNVAVIPAPTPLPPDALLLGLMSDASFTDEFDTLNVVGEVRNDSNLDVGEMSVIISFYDATGSFISEARGETMVKTLAPGQRSPFQISLDRPNGMSNYSIKAVGRPVSVNLAPQVVVVRSRQYEDSVGFYHVDGVIENRGSVPVKQAKVVVTLYGRDGGIINVNFAYPLPDRLEPGDQATFDVQFTYFPKILEHKVIVTLQ